MDFSNNQIRLTLVVRLGIYTKNWLSSAEWVRSRSCGSLGCSNIRSNANCQPDWVIVNSAHIFNHDDTRCIGYCMTLLSDNFSKAIRVTPVLVLCGVLMGLMTNPLSIRFSLELVCLTVLHYPKVLKVMHKRTIFFFPKVHYNLTHV